MMYLFSAEPDNLCSAVRLPASQSGSLACGQTVGRAKAKENRSWEGGGQTINVWKGRA